MTSILEFIKSIGTLLLGISMICLSIYVIYFLGSPIKVEYYWATSPRFDCEIANNDIYLYAEAGYQSIQNAEFYLNNQLLCSVKNVEPYQTKACKANLDNVESRYIVITVNYTMIYDRNIHSTQFFCDLSDYYYEKSSYYLYTYCHPYVKDNETKYLYIELEGENIDNATVYYNNRVICSLDDLSDTRICAIKNPSQEPYIITIKYYTKGELKEKDVICD